MGGTASSIYGHCRRLVMRYNAENRAHRFLEIGKLPPAPRHSVNENSRKAINKVPKGDLEELHAKNEQLNEYLKKVYLTSTSQITGTPSKRPKPKKENEILKTKMFYEPEKPASGCCTLTNVIEILLKFQDDSNLWNASELAKKFNLNKRDIVQLLMYHSLFKIETFEFMHDKEVKVEPEKIEFEVYNQLEKKPLKQIKGK